MLIEGWSSQVVDEYFEEEFASNGTAVLKTIKVPGSPNGLPYGEQYFEQSRGDIEAYREYQEAQKNRTILELNQEKYDNTDSHQSQHKRINKRLRQLTLHVLSLFRVIGQLFENLVQMPGLLTRSHHCRIQRVKHPREFRHCLSQTITFNDFASY